MKSNLLSCFLLIIPFISYSQDSISIENYQKAESMLSWNTSKLTDQMDLRPIWQEDGSFWYKNLLADGVEYIHFDPKTKKKKTASTSKEIKEGLPK